MDFFSFFPVAWGKHLMRRDTKKRRPCHISGQACYSP